MRNKSLKNIVLWFSTKDCTPEKGMWIHVYHKCIMQDHFSIATGKKTETGKYIIHDQNGVHTIEEGQVHYWAFHIEKPDLSDYQ